MTKSYHTTNNKKLEYLACIFCNHTFELNETFIAWHNHEGFVVIAVCKYHYKNVENHAPTESGCWHTLMRQYDRYLLLY